MVTTLEPERLKSYRGAPFPSDLVDAAVQSIRRECHWHIGPVEDDTAEVMTDGRRLKLPTLRLVEVVEILDGDDPDAGPYEGRLRVRRDGIVEALGSDRLPGFARVEFRHGFEEFPAELLPIVAERARSASKGRVTAESLASRSVSLEGGVDPLTSPMLAAFRLERGPGA